MCMQGLTPDAKPHPRIYDPEAAIAFEEQRKADEKVEQAKRKRESEAWNVERPLICWPFARLTIAKSFKAYGVDLRFSRGVSPIYVCAALRGQQPEVVGALETRGSRCEWRRERLHGRGDWKVSCACNTFPISECCCGCFGSWLHAASNWNPNGSSLKCFGSFVYVVFHSGLAYPW